MTRGVWSGSTASGRGAVLTAAALSTTVAAATVAVVAVTGGVASATTGQASAVAGAAPAVGVAATYNIRSYGAKGDGNANEASAFEKAITAANAAGGGIVQVPSGTYKVASTVHLRSNVTIQLDSGATVRGAGSGYDAPESNPNDNYQDYGHSHFHNAMFYGDRLSNIGFTGSGTIDGGGNLITGNPKSGQADKIISLTRCKGLTLNGITLRRGGHFAALINGCDNVRSDRLTIRTADDRDGWNIISTTNVTITGADIAANDDALVFKSDYALGQKLPNGHVTVTNSKLSAGCCNALMFGSETCGDFTDYDFSAITITGAGKSGLGLVSMDGAKISNVRYRDITMSGTESPIMLKVGTRKRCGNNPGVGDISDIHFTNITGTDAGKYSPTIWGQSGHEVRNVTFDNVKLNVPGGNGTMDPTKVPSDNGDYNPRSIGTRPAYGWYLHHVNGLRFTNSSVSFSDNDKRPAVIANAGADITFDRFSAERGSGSPFDLGFQNINGYCVTGSGSPRVSASGSSKSC
ncbi:glycoside hydrolase family 28 protein [Planosporangium sp. 12N6]|uniref:glycoside hydrolase family 28 protein n=1 Tax=Planosporangium spinosum TaxID=3402278 RepID=UPI003CF03637